MKKDTNSYTIVINNLPLWNVHKEIFQSSRTPFLFNELIFPIKERNEDELFIDIAALKENDLFPQFVEDIEGKIHGIKILKEWIKSMNLVQISFPTLFLIY